MAKEMSKLLWGACGEMDQKCFYTTENDVTEIYDHKQF